MVEAQGEVLPMEELELGLQRLRGTLPLEHSGQALGERHLGLDAVSP